MVYYSKISIHAPREGCDARRLYCGDHAGQFQSTHPARGATIRIPEIIPGLYEFQSTHPARGATTRKAAIRLTTGISIHAPREGCDVYQRVYNYIVKDFNPRTPRGVRPMEDGDRVRKSHNFNPRTPRGVRRSIATSIPALRNFNPRTPRGCDRTNQSFFKTPQQNFNPRTPRGVRRKSLIEYIVCA